MITANAKGAHTLVIGGTNTYAGVNGTYNGTSRTDTDLVDAINAGITADPELAQGGLAGHDRAAATPHPGLEQRHLLPPQHGRQRGNREHRLRRHRNGELRRTDRRRSRKLTCWTPTAPPRPRPSTISALAYGNDDQAITVSANDANGALQTNTITLRKNERPQPAQRPQHR